MLKPADGENLVISRGDAPPTAATPGANCVPLGTNRASVSHDLLLRRVSRKSVNKSPGNDVKHRTCARCSVPAPDLEYPTKFRGPETKTRLTTLGYSNLGPGDFPFERRRSPYWHCARPAYYLLCSVLGRRPGKLVLGGRAAAD